MSINITAVEYYLPKNIVANDDLIKENPEWDLKNVETKSGIITRHIASENETALDLAVEACNKLYQKQSQYLERIDGIIFCTQSPDYIMPPNSYLLHKHLRLHENIMAYDFNLACSGYVYSLAMANSFITSGLAKKILLVNADTYSKYISKKDRSTRVLFGDGAAITIVEKSDRGRGMIDVDFISTGKNFDKFYIPAGGCRLPKSNDTSKEEMDRNGNIRSKNDIYMDGMAVWAAINSVVPKQIKNLLDRNKLELADIDLFLFHQASQMTLESLIKVLGIDKDKVYIDLADKGNTVSATIPIALKDAMEMKKLTRGSLVLMSGFGVGMSYATMIIEF